MYRHVVYRSSFTRCGVTNFRRRAELLKIKHAASSCIIVPYWHQKTKMACYSYMRISKCTGAILNVPLGGLNVSEHIAQLRMVQLPFFL